MKTIGMHMTALMFLGMWLASVLELIDVLAIDRAAFLIAGVVGWAGASIIDALGDRR